MSPVDNTPEMSDANTFQHLHSLMACGITPVHEYKSTRTGITVVIAEVEGPVVNGFFCLATEAHDDDGLPHTLEHLIFLGSEDYPCKGVLDRLANRCLASGTNAWTDVDHTCYTMETAGSDGFLTLMPIYLDHILYPTLTDEGFITEVHHVTGDGDDAGVVYCEMQNCENNAERKIQRTVARKIYPGFCGYSATTGGVMKNLRESTDNVKVREYHKTFYRAENLKLIITGKIKPEDVFRTLECFERKILSKGALDSFTRPWQCSVPPFNVTEELIVKYPSDEETNGNFVIAWRGPSAVVDQYKLLATTMFMKYLCDLSISPLQKEFVEIPDPYASKVSFNLSENSETCIYFHFHNVPIDKMPFIESKLSALLREMSEMESIDMQQVKNVILRHIQENLSIMENDPHRHVAFMIIGHILYGTTKDDLEQRVNPLPSLNKLLEEPKLFWVQLLKKYFVDGHHLSVQGMPSIEEQNRLAQELKARVDKQREELGSEGLKAKEELLNAAIDSNERHVPENILTSVPIPSLQSISFHSIERFSTTSSDKRIDLTNSPVFTYFDHVKTNFVYIYVMMDTSSVPEDLRLYLPIMLETLFETSIRRGEKIIPREEVVTELNIDLIGQQTSLGLAAGPFKCGTNSMTAVAFVQAESGKINKAISWLREILYDSIFEVDVLKIIANKMVNNVAHAKRSGRNVLYYILRSLLFAQNSNIQANGILRQHAFLTKILQQLDSDDASNVVDTLNSVRDLLVQPQNVSIYCAANLDIIANIPETLEKFLPERMKSSKCQNALKISPDHQLLMTEQTLPSCIVGLGCLESSFFCQAVPSINDLKHPDLPAVLLYLQYLIQTEGPVWKLVRGKGYAYSYTMKAKTNEGLLYLVFGQATNVVGAYIATKDYVTTHLREKIWDSAFLASARSSLIFEIIEEEKTIGSAVSLSLSSYLQAVDYKYNRQLLGLIDKVTIDDLNRVGEKYIADLFDASKAKTVIVCDPCKAEEICNDFRKCDLSLKLYPSLEESFLKV